MRLNILKSHMTRSNLEGYSNSLLSKIKSLYEEISYDNSGKVKVQVVLDRGGCIVSMSIFCSSGHEYLDNYAKKIIEDACPFKDFPEDSLHHYLDIIITIIFKHKENHERNVN